MVTRIDIKKARICIQCGKIVGKLLTGAEEREFLRSKMCPKCFKEAMEQQIRDPGPLRTKVELTMDNWATILRLVRSELKNNTIASVRELRAIEDAIINMAFEKAKRGKNDKA